MSLSKEQFERLDRAVRDIEEIIGNVGILECISLLTGVRNNPAMFTGIIQDLEEIEAQDDS